MAAPQGPPPGSGPGSYGPPGYGAPGYGAGPYGAPGYGYGPPQVEHPQGIIVLILGILGIVTCPILGPFAWVMGNRALAEIDADPGRYSNRGLVNGGRICGIAGTVIIGVYLVLGVAYVLFFATILFGTSTA